MMSSTIVRPERPYKFLDAYTRDDASIFFGRDRETRVLVTDVMVNRLVVLFARTGTGKTSLINAAARPRLEEQGYTTFFIRVHQDPVASARAVLAEHPAASSATTGSLAGDLAEIVRKLRRPVVLFFDQFEEFFIYVQSSNPEKAREFIGDVARLYRNRESGVHFVFSMREEFFVEMDAFRDEIPNIFHNESNLRLRRLDRQEAYEAIVHPARVFDVRLEADLVEQMLDDLAAAANAGGSIEPAQLQIVADALWDKREGGRLALAHYRSLGRQESRDNIAQQILYGRLQEAFSTIESRQQLDLLERLLGELRTKQGTKWVRDVEALTQFLISGTDATREDVRTLLRLLESVRFIHRATRDKLEVIELSHDYLVDRIDELQQRVRLIWPQRLVFAATRDLLPSREDLKDIAALADRLEISRDDAVSLFAAAVNQSEQPERWFAIASAAGADPAGLLSTWTLHTDASPLVTQMSIRAIEHLLQSVDISEKGQLMAILEAALQREQTTIDAQESMIRLAQTAGQPIADAAERRLLLLVRKRITAGRLAPSIAGWLTAKRRPDVVPLLRRFLERPELAFDAQAALMTIVVSPEWAPDAEDARNVLLQWVDTRLDIGIEQIAPQTIGSLDRLDDYRTVDVLARALHQRAFAVEAKTALERAAGSANAEIARRARRVLAAGFDDGIVPSAASIPLDEERGARRFHAYTDHDTERVAQAILASRCVVIVGAGIHSPSPRDSPTFATYADRGLLTSELAERIARVSAYEGRDTGDFRRVMQFAEARMGRRALITEVEQAIRQTKQPSPLLRLLADLPIRVWVTTNYDMMLEQALTDVGKRAISVRIGRTENQDLDFARFQQHTVVKLHGDITEPSSLVLTEDDFIDFVLEARHSRLPFDLRGAIATGHVVLLGWNYRSIENRFMLRLLTSSDRDRGSIYAVDPTPDPLLRQWQKSQGIRVIEDDLWSFVPRLHAAVRDRGRP